MTGHPSMPSSIGVCTCHACSAINQDLCRRRCSPHSAAAAAATPPAQQPDGPAPSRPGHAAPAAPAASHEGRSRGRQPAGCSRARRQCSELACRQPAQAPLHRGSYGARGQGGAAGAALPQPSRCLVTMLTTAQPQEGFLVWVSPMAAIGLTMWCGQLVICQGTNMCSRDTASDGAKFGMICIKCGIRCSAIHVLTCGQGESANTWNPSVGSTLGPTNSAVHHTRPCPEVTKGCEEQAACRR